MTKIREDAIKAYAAEVLEQIAANGSNAFVVPESHRAGVLEGLEQAERRHFANDEEVTDLWKKCGL